jgi:hypothetical protein
MRNDRHLAIKLRKKGSSYQKISEELGIPESTMHYWFKDLPWSEEIKKKLTKKSIKLSRERIKKVVKANRERWAKWRNSFRETAQKEFTGLKKIPLFIAGLMLYWGEGDQNLKYEVRLSNIKPEMIALFNKFLLNICKIPKEDIFLYIIIYPDLVDKKCKDFWSKKIHISLDQFDKTQTIYGRHPTKRLENGICSIRVKRSRWLKEKIIVWIDLLSKDLIKN